MYIYRYMYIHVYVHTYVYMYIYIYIYIHRNLHLDIFRLLGQPQGHGGPLAQGVPGSSEREIGVQPVTEPSLPYSTLSANSVR